MAYKISSFITDAKAILAKPSPLHLKQQEIGERMSALSKRDDLMQFGIDLGPADAAAGQRLLWLEGAIFLMIVSFDEYSRSTVHAHGDFWVIGCGYRGRDRWDIYTRRDDGADPGRAKVDQTDEIVVEPGDVVWMPPPPSAIHSHNNIAAGRTLELVFSAVEPNPPEERLIFNLDECTCYPSSYNVGRALSIDRYPPQALSATEARSLPKRSA